MKIRFIQTLSVNVINPTVDEDYLKSYNKWDEFFVDRIDYSGSLATVFSYDGIILMDVPVGTFEIFESNSRSVVF